MSTPLSEIESMSSSGGGDVDLVNQIMREMNGGGDSRGGPAMPPPMSSAAPAPIPMSPPPQPMMNAPTSNTALAGHVMDNGPATAHIIGGAAPTPADFAAAMHGMNGSGGVSLQAAYGAPAPPPPPPPAVPKRSLTKKVAEEFKLPILVVILVFVFSLPVVNFLFAHYLPRFVLPTGQLTTVGLLVKSAAAGATFWLLQRVIIPLLSV